MKYRIAERQGKFYPQVKTSWFQPWRKIGIHPGGEFGLYNNWSYGWDSYDECLEIIKTFGERQQVKAIYHDLNLKP